MLVLSEAQMAAFRQAAGARCEQRLLSCLADSFPGEFKLLGAGGMLTVLRLGMARAARHGFDTEQQIYLYLTLMLMLGSFFDEDPQLPWIQTQLAETVGIDPFQRILALHETTMDYLDRVAGAENQHLIWALSRLKSFDPAEFDTLEAAGFPARCVAKLSGFFPEKAELQGEPSLFEVFALARQAAAKHGIVTQSGIGLFAGLMFMLGSGFEGDPQFPWVVAALADRQNPTAAAHELHRQAMVFLRHGLSGQPASDQ